jgi:hypothetical protein
LSKHSDLEQRALKLIMEKGDEGILQRDMWRELGATSRDGSRIALRLEAQQLITRERELANGDGRIASSSTCDAWNSTRFWTCPVFVVTISSSVKWAWASPPPNVRS